VVLFRLFLLIILHLSQAIEVGRVTCAFYRGARRSDGLFWVLFLAAEKKYLACGARTAMPNEFTSVNIAQLERTHLQKLNQYRGMKKIRSYKKF